MAAWLEINLTIQGFSSAVASIGGIRSV